MKNTIATVAILTSFCLAERDCRAELLGSFDFGTESTLERGEGEASLSIDDSGKWEKSSENSGFLTVNGTVPTRAVSLTCPPNFINAASFLLQFSFKVDSQAEGQFSTYTYLISSDHFYLRLNADATLLISPADHLIINETRFEQIIRTAWQTAQDGKLVTLGIAPTRPDTGYGYIEFEKTEHTQQGTACPVLQFREKPDLQTAEQFLEAGNFFWNAGIFIWKAQIILDALAQHQSDVYQIFSAQPEVYGSAHEHTFLKDAFAACPDISIDFAVMEKAQNVSMVLADFDWSDLGTWGSLTTHLPKDEQQNSIIGKNVFAFESENCLVNITHDKTVLLDGLKDYIVVETADKLMVLRLSNEQKLKEYLKTMGVS